VTTVVRVGDAVAIANTCGDWAYVQSITKNRVAVGWLRKDNLTAVQGVAPDSSSTGFHVAFTLTVGNGVPVCEAYLQRLNQTVFTQPAYCGRPESNAVPGFSVLNRVRLNLADIRPLQPWILAILNPDTQLPSSELHSIAKSGGLLTEVPSSAIELVHRYYEKGTSSWTYASPLDIGNDGHPVPVLIWDAAVDNQCGEFAHRGDNAAQIPFVLSLDRASIDQRKTMAVFGRPGGATHIPEEGPSGADGVHDFLLPYYAVIGGSYGVFEYRDKFYFDTFFDAANGDGDFQGKRRRDANLPDILGVFMSKKGHTHQVCELFTRDN
jgi:hypothetical protein